MRVTTNREGVRAPRSTSPLRLLALVCATFGAFGLFVGFLIMLARKYPFLEPRILPALLSIVAGGILSYACFAGLSGRVFDRGSIYDRLGQPFRFWFWTAFYFAIGSITFCVGIYLLTRADR
jgi:formate-dependent nitrite reductase membrane component NrfD